MDNTEWKLKFPGTAAALERINAAHDEERKAAEAERVARITNAEARRVQKLSQSKDGRAELAAMALKQLKERESVAHAARLAEGKGAAATDENKRKRAERRDREVARA